MAAGRCTNAAKIESIGSSTCIEERARQRGDHLVVHGAAKQGMRVCDHRHRTCRHLCVHMRHHLNGPGFAVEQ